MRSHVSSDDQGFSKRRAASAFPPGEAEAEALGAPDGITGTLILDASVLDRAKARLKSAPLKMSMLPPKDLRLSTLNRSTEVLLLPNEAPPLGNCERLPVMEDPPDSTRLREREWENGGAWEEFDEALMATGSVEEKGESSNLALLGTGFVEDSRREALPALSDTTATSGK